MQEYTVEVKKIYSKVIIVKGYDKNHAELVAKQKYIDLEIEFTEEDFLCPGFEVLENLDDYKD